ncbi:hypothetical protein D3C81_2241060 [compost metagenome]
MVDQTAFGQVFDRRAGILYIALAPAQVQGLAIFATITSTAPIVQVGNGEATLGPVLNPWVQHRIAG